MHTSLLDVSLNCTLRTITGYLQHTSVERLPVLVGLQPRLKSRRPFATSGKDLSSTTLSNETKAHSHWIAKMWSVEWQSSTSRLRE